MKRILVLLVLSFVLLPLLAAAPSKDAVESAIAAFEKDPTGKEGAAAAKTILAFVKESTAVHISIDRQTAPWLKDQNAPDADSRGVLLTAYLAGDLQAQLAAGRPQDDPYAGWKQVLATYTQLQHMNPEVKIDEIDKLKEQEADGKLQGRAAEIAGK